MGSTISGPSVGVDSTVGAGAIVSKTGVVIIDGTLTTGVEARVSGAGDGVRGSSKGVGMTVFKTGDRATIDTESGVVGVGSGMPVNAILGGCNILGNIGITDDMLSVKMTVFIREGVIDKLTTGSEDVKAIEVVTIIGGGFKRISSILELRGPSTEYSATVLLVKSLLVGPDLSNDDFELLNM